MNTSSFTIKAWFLIKEWSPILWRCAVLAIIIGLTLGIGSGVVLEAWNMLSTLELGLILGVALWVSSLLLAIYITESQVKRRFMSMTYVYNRHVPHSQTLHHRPVNRN